MSIPRLVWGAAAVAAYVAAVLVAQIGGLVPIRPLYDGLAPPVPYRFVDPPGDLAEENEEPEDGDGMVELTKKGSESSSVATGDGQLSMIVTENTFRPADGEDAVVVRIVPLKPPDPLDIGRGDVISGNAYRVTAAYEQSKEPAAIRKSVTVVMRYPVMATVMVRREGSAWRRLRTQTSHASLQLFADTDELGVFAAAGEATEDPWWRKVLPYAAGAIGLVAGVYGYRRGRRSARRKAQRRRPPKRRMKPIVTAEEGPPRTSPGRESKGLPSSRRKKRRR